LVSVAFVPLIMPVIEPVELLVIDKAGVPLVASAIAPAVSCAVVMVRPVSGVAPTVPLKVVLPPVLVVRLYAPETVELNSRLPLAVLVRLVSAPKVTAPV
jgi:hypothetical protein